MVVETVHSSRSFAPYNPQPRKTHVNTITQKLCLPDGRLTLNRYEGRRSGHTVVVSVDGQPLDPRLDLRNHSPSGFEWGYGGSGPAQLALAILANYMANSEQALELYQSFKWEVITKLPMESWALTSDEIESAIQRLRHKDGGGS